MKRLTRIFLFLIVGVLAGCGGPAMSGGGSATTVLSSRGSAQVRQNVKVLPSDGSVTVVDVTDATVTLSGAVPPLDIGDVVVANQPPLEFARKVTATRTASGATVLTTTTITLADVFSSADLERVETVAPAVFANLQPTLPGESFGPVTKQPGKNVYTLPIRFVNTYVTGLNGEPGLVLNGLVNVDLTFDTALKLTWYGTVSEFRVVPTVVATGNLKVTAQAGVGFKRTVPMTPSVKIPLTPLGPLVLSIDLKLNLDIDARLAAKAEMETSGSVTATFGPRLKDGQWSMVRNFDYTFNITAPRVEAEASVWVSAGQPQLAVSLLGVASAWLKADVAKAGLEIRVVSTPTPGVSGQARLKFGATAGIDLLLAATVPLASGVIGPYDIGPSFFYSFADIYDLTVRAFAPAPQIRVGEVLQLEPAAQLATNTPADQVAVTWTQQSSDGGSVAIGPNDQVQGLTPGTVVLTASHQGKTATFDVTVTAPTLQSVRIIGNLSPREGGLMHLSAIARYSDGTTQDVSSLCTWMSSDASVVTLDADGSEYAVKRGTAQITATYVDFATPANAKTGVAQAEVLAADVVAFDVEPQGGAAKTASAQGAAVGQVLRYRAYGFVADASRRDVTSKLTWTSSAPATATVDAAGTVRTLAPGFATIRAIDPGTGASQAVDLVVSHAPLASLAITPVPPTLQQGQTVQLQAIGHFSDASVEDVSQTYDCAWFSGDPSVATVSPGGLVTAVHAGPVTIFCQALHQQDALTLTVNGPELLAVTTIPASVLSGAPFSIDVAVMGTDGQPFTGGSPTVRLSLPAGASGVVLGGTLTTVASNGRAVFNNVTLTGSGSVPVVATSSGLTTVQSAAVTVTP